MDRINYSKIPVNGLYFTSSDFQEWGDYFSSISPYAQKVTEIDPENRHVLALTLTFVVTERCNLRCTYCYESHEIHKCGKRMTKEVADKAIDMIFDEEKTKGYFTTENKPGVILEFIGGEPLLEIDLIDYITDRFRLKAFEKNHPWATNHMISISTNGTLYDNEKVEKYLQKNKNNVSVTITIDGNKDLHDSCRLFPDGRGSYDIVEKAVKKNYEGKFKKTTKLTLAPENIEHIVPAFINCWENLGCDMIYANCVYEHVWEDHHPLILFNNLVKLADYMLENKIYETKATSILEETIGQKLTDDNNYCGGNGEMLAIGPDGTCYPCLRFMQHSMKSNRPAFTCGHVDDCLADKSKDEKLCHLCSVKISTQSPDKCLSCDIGQGCGLCTAYNYDYFGDPNKRATAICGMHKARVMASSYYYNKLYKKLNLPNRFKLNLKKELALEIIDEATYNMLKELEE